MGAVGPEWEIAFWQRCIIAGRAVFFYASKLVWPTKLSFIYPRWNPAEFSALGLLWPAAAIALTLVLWSGRKSIGWAPLIAWAGFVITLFPALGFFNIYPFRYSFVADHFQYLASIFCITLFVGLGYVLYKRLCSRGLKFLAFPSVQIVLTSVVLLLLGYLTHDQARMYEDVEKLWTTTIDRNPTAWMACYNRGTLYLKKGESDDAIADYNQAIRLDPKFAKAYTNRGVAHADKGELDKAIADYNQAIRFDPKFAKAYNNLAWIFATHPDPQIRDGAQAVRLAERACQLTNYKAPSLLDTLAAAYAEAGQFENAVKTAQKAVQLARAAKSKKLAKNIQSRLDLYKANRPYRTPARGTSISTLHRGASRGA